MNIYLDAGFYAGNALRLLYQAGVVDKTWTIYAFDPNPDIDLGGTLKEYDLDIEIIPKAVWIRNGTVRFRIGGRDDAACVKGTAGQSDFKELNVECIDFSKFVSQLPEARIICSMDIEGSEFKVLDKMIKEGSIDRIEELSVEFHHRLMISKDSSDAAKLIKKINERGVKVRLKEAI